MNQMARCYSINRRTQNPLQFYVTNFKGQSKTIVEKHSGFSNWDVSFLILIAMLNPWVKPFCVVLDLICICQSFCLVAKKAAISELLDFKFGKWTP